MTSLQSSTCSGEQRLPSSEQIEKIKLGMHAERKSFSGRKLVNWLEDNLAEFVGDSSDGNVLEINMVKKHTCKTDIFSSAVMLRSAEVLLYIGNRFSPGSVCMIVR